MEDQSERRRFVVLPALNNFNARGSTESVKMSRSLARAASLPQTSGTLRRSGELANLPDGPIRVVERIDRDASVVEMSENQRLALTALYPGLMVRPEVRLRLLRPTPLRARLQSVRVPKRSATKRLEVVVLDALGAPVKGVEVAVIFNLARSTGVDDLVTDEVGRVEVALPSRQNSIELVSAHPFSGHWPGCLSDVQVTPDGVTSVVITVVPIEQGFQDGLDRLLPNPRPGGAGKGVRIGIVDTGVSGPSTLTIARARNTTGAEDEALSDDNGSGHGTHVAGIVARLAPDAEIYSYRVFEEGADDAGEAAISRAIREAVDDGCDLVNLSFGQNEEAISITRELRRARALGTLCIAAAGNDFGGEVTYPATSAYVMGVTACGHRAGWPDGTAMQPDVAEEPEAIGDVFFASFSNVGRDVDFMMPGSGIISTVSPTGVGIMSGTSMAAPAATGLIARLLSEEAMLLDQNTSRDQARSDAIASLAARNCGPLGFGALYEGRGLVGRP